MSSPVSIIDDQIIEVMSSPVSIINDQIIEVISSPVSIIDDQIIEVMSSTVSITHLLIAVIDTTALIRVCCCILYCDEPINTTSGIEIRKNFYLSAGQVTMSDWLVRKFFRLSKKSCTDQRSTTSFAKNKHNNKVSCFMQQLGYYYLLPRMHNGILQCSH